MKCPECSYEDFLYGDDGGVQGTCGDFYQSTMSRYEGFSLRGTEKIKLFGCPNCLKTFLSKEPY